MREVVNTLSLSPTTIDQVLDAFFSVRDFSQLAGAWQKAAEMIAAPDYFIVCIRDPRNSQQPWFVASQGFDSTEKTRAERSLWNSDFSSCDWPAAARSSFVASIFFEEKCVGYLGLASRCENAFSEHCIALINVATKIARRHYYDLSYWQAFRERTEIVMAEQQRALIHSSKMSALGKMASGIAHEINNPLAIICCKAQLLADLAQSGQLKDVDIAADATKIDETAMRIAKIVRSLRTFARESTTDAFQLVRVRALIDDALSFCQESFRKNSVQLIVEDFSEDLSLECSISQLAQVFLNLLSNAIDALESVEEKWIRIDVKENVQENEKFVEIAVTDSGRGIPAALREKIFEPFFTTKEPGKGIGLGLSISLGIVEGHRGKMIVDATSPNTRFVIQLPKPRTDNLIT